jgi:chorismate mutase
MSLEKLRGEIEAVDLEIMRLIKARMDIAIKIAEEKAAAGAPTRDPERVEVVLNHVARQAELSGMDPGPIRDIFTSLIRMSESLQDKKRGSE